MSKWTESQWLLYLRGAVSCTVHKVSFQSVAPILQIEQVHFRDQAARGGVVVKANDAAWLLVAGGD
jgi:hypothetical protein